MRPAFAAASSRRLGPVGLESTFGSKGRGVRPTTQSESCGGSSSVCGAASRTRDVYLRAYETPTELRAGLARYFGFYNTKRRHSASRVADFSRLPLRQSHGGTNSPLYTPLDNAIFDIDVHRIPARGREPAHFHFDVRFLVQAKHDRFRVSDEWHALA